MSKFQRIYKNIYIAQKETMKYINEEVLICNAIILWQKVIINDTVPI